MLVRLMYASRASEQIGAEDLEANLRVSKSNNVTTGVTGVLVFCLSRLLLYSALAFLRSFLVSSISVLLPELGEQFPRLVGEFDPNLALGEHRAQVFKL